MIGNTREQLFHAWRSFHFEKNTDMLDACITCIRQVATLLGYGKPQVLDIFKNTLPTRWYWYSFPIEDLRLVIETAKRMLTEGKIDRQLAGQSSSTPFMNTRDGSNSKKLLHLTCRRGLDDKIDKLIPMISKLAAQSSNQNKQFKPNIYQGKRRRQQ